MAATLADVCAVLDGLQIKHRIVQEHVRLAACFPKEPGILHVVTSAKTIQEYDPDHPQRITCLIMGHDNQHALVVVKNREVDLKAAISLWYNKFVVGKFKYSNETLECAVCYASPAGCSRKRPFSFTTCKVCYCVVCVECFNKLDMDDAFKCPVCRQWSLDGEAFGTPASVMMPLPPLNNNEVPPITAFIKILEKLDGCCHVVPRIGPALAIGDTISFTRPTFVNKQVPAAAKKKLKRIVETHSTALLYTIRETYAIDKEQDMPVCEVSAFLLTKTDIVQISPDWWVDVIPAELTPMRARRKVVYTKPGNLKVPAHFMDLFVEINNNYKGRTKTVCLVCNKTAVCSFDVDAEGNILTIEDVRLAMFIAMYGPTLVTCRIFSYGDENTVDLVSYSVASSGYKQLDAQANKKLWQSNVDGLKKATHVKCFV